MTGGLRLREAVVIGALLAVSVAGTVAAMAGRGPDEAFLLRQSRPAVVTQAAVEKLILTAPDPAPPHVKPGIASSCRAGSSRGLRNPWRCTVRYRNGNRASLIVTIKEDGSYVARYVGDTATATGCCLDFTTAG